MQCSLKKAFVLKKISFSKILKVVEKMEIWR